MVRPKTTRLSADVTKPQPTAAGDAPADTWDEKERASSARPDKASAAVGGHQTVNAVVPAAPIPTPAPPANPRTETFSAFNAQGVEVTVTRNVETGATTVAPAGG